MKKILTVVLSFAFALAFAGCGTANDGNSVDSSGKIENSGTESSSNDASNSIFEDESDNSDSDGSAAETPPASGNENELPLVPID